jgi:dihydropteroate synthase
MNAAPAPIRCGNLTLRFGERPYLMGILNVTPDSFSDGGQFADAEAAVRHALEMVEAGADLLDVGGESSRPGSEPIPADDEIARVVPVIEQLAKWTTVPISIDTTKAAVAQAAIDAGAALVNDISALRLDPEMGAVIAKARVPAVLMHMRGIPKSMQEGPIVYTDLMGEIRAFLTEAIQRAVAAGIPEDQIIVDPGIGFGKTPEHNLAILHRLRELESLGRPLLIGSSRKAFIGKVLRAEATERLFGTAATVAAAVAGGAHILRVHDVGSMRQVAQVAWAIERERLPGPSLKREKMP